MSKDLAGLPKGWQLVRLGDHCLKTNQKDPTKQPDKTYIYIDVSSVSNESFRITNYKEIQGKNAPSRARKIIRANDAIFATVRPTLKRIALIPEVLDNQICSTGFCVIRANQTYLNSEFTYYFLLSEYVANRVDNLQKGATYPAISDSDLYDLEIPLMSLEEQRAIATTLRTIQTAKEARQKELALERERKAALMDYLFTHGTRNEPRKQTELGEIPESWQVVELEAIAEIQSGGTPSRTRQDYYDGNIAWVKTLDLNEGIVNATEEKITSLGLSSIRGKIRPVNSVMIAMYGGSGTVGKCGILGIPAVTNQAVCAIEPNPTKFDSFFLLHYMLYFRRDWMRYAGGTRKDPNIGKGIIESTKIPFPTLQEQQEIADILSSCDAKIATLEREIKLHDELFRAMLEELMTGQLSSLPLASRET